MSEILFEHNGLIYIGVLVAAIILFLFWNRRNRSQLKDRRGRRFGEKLRQRSNQDRD